MIKITKIILIFIIIFFQKSIAIENKILLKVDSEIITNIDVDKELKYLSTLNNNIANLNIDAALSFSKNSILKEKIKEIALEKIVNLDDINDNITDQFFLILFKRLNLNDLNEFETLLNKNGLELNFVRKKIKIETAWNQLIYQKYNSKIRIDVDKIKQDLKNLDNQITSYLLSEIFFYSKNKEDLEKKTKIIKLGIQQNSFEKAAFTHSESDTSSNGGKLDWISENSLDEKILKELRKIKITEFTNPIRISGGFMILKIEDKKYIKKKINYEDEFNKIVNFKTNQQLEGFSKIYYEKIKKDLTINEL